jgi:citrate synthase
LPANVRKDFRGRTGVHIGKPGRAVTSICGASADRLEVRGRDLTGDLMGRLSFTDYFFLLVTGREPSPDQRYFLDLLLVAIAEHGLVPTVQAARMTLAADPNSLQGAVAAGILGAGPVILGTSELCARLLKQAEAKVAAGGNADAVALELVREIRAAGGKAPGFGHPLHKPVDPRSERIFALAAERGVAGKHVDMAKRICHAVATVWGKPLVMNVSMPIAAVLLDLGFPASMVKAIPILARTASLLAHLAEEQQNPIGFLMAGHGEDAIAYEPGSVG